MMRGILLAAAAVFTLPAMVSVPETGIDPSWELGLHLARDQGLIVGKDIVFNYGPWGFLNVPLTLTRSLWLAAVGYGLVRSQAARGGTRCRVSQCGQGTSRPAWAGGTLIEVPQAQARNA